MANAFGPAVRDESGLPARRTLARLALTGTLLLSVLFASTARGQTPVTCWLDTVEQPTTGDGLPVTHASVAPLRDALIRMDNTARANPVLQRLSNARLRNARFVGIALPETGPRTGEMTVVVYAPNAWADGCTLIPQADRIRAAMVTFSVNSPGVVLSSPRLKDEALVAYAEPRVTGRIGAYPTYAHSRAQPSDPGGVVILTADDRVPWVPVPVAAYLDYQEREVRRRLADIKGAGTSLEDAGFQAMYELLRSTNPTAAEELKKTMADGARRMTEATAAAEEELRALQAHRASLSAGALEAQARVGQGPFLLAEDGAPGTPLVKADPAFGWDTRDLNRVQLVVVSVTAARREYLPELTKALEAMDFDALRALIR